MLVLNTALRKILKENILGITKPDIRYAEVLIQTYKGI